MSEQYRAFGINHESAPVSLRERFELSVDQIRDVNQLVRNRVSCEWMLISTCNRTECYLYGHRSDVGILRAAIEEVGNDTWPIDVSFEVSGPAAVLHIMEVTAGLKSQVLGDVQILNQIKTGYRAAHEGKTLGPSLHHLMHSAFATSKRVLTQTGISQGNPSIATLATRVARRIVSQHRSASANDPVQALVLGAGEMGCRIAQVLYHDRAVQPVLANRTLERAEAVATQYGATVVPWEDRISALADMDVVFVTTSSRTFVLDAEAPPRNERPLLIIDVSVPRNVDPRLNEVEGYRVIDIDALQQIKEREVETQERGLEEARTLCREATDAMAEWEYQQRLLQPAIETLNDAFESVRQQVVERNLHRFDAACHDQVDQLTRSITQKLLAIPVVHLKNDRNGTNGMQERVAVLTDLFTRPNCEE